jgi:hypothetical protein
VNARRKKATQETNKIKMKTPTDQKPALSRDEIAALAWQIWEKEGSQHGRDQEYWFRAEQQLLAARQQEITPANVPAAARKIPPARANSTFRA